MSTHAALRLSRAACAGLTARSSRLAPHGTMHSHRALSSLPSIVPRHPPRYSLTRRPFTSTSHRTTSTPPPAADSTSFPDPDRPDLFYHLFPPPTPLSASAPAFALSFLPTPPPSARSATVIGWLPASAPDADEAGLNDFVENAAFRALLHDAVLAALRDGADEVQANAAVQTQQGWMHIHDERNIPALGRVGDPDDILASVRVEDGKILPETYQAMPAYRVCTADGVVQLTEGLARRLREVLEARAKAEVEVLGA